MSFEIHRLKTHKDGQLVRVISDDPALAIAGYTTVIPEGATEVYDATFRHAGIFESLEDAESWLVSGEPEPRRVYSEDRIDRAERADRP